MNGWIESPFILLVLLNLLLLGSSRLANCIRLVALEGIVLGFLTLGWRDEPLSYHTLFLLLASLGIKGAAFPWLLFRTLRQAGVKHEVEPIIGFNTSIVVGILALGVSLWLGSRLPLPTPAFSPLIVPVALFTMLTGLFLIISRQKALTQTLGYLVLENGIYIFSTALVHKEPILVEMGILLDVFFAVFVMGIAIYHINREFNHIDTDQLTSLRD